MNPGATNTIFNHFDQAFSQLLGVYKDGSKSNPVQCFERSEAFDCARERGRPVWCFIEEGKELIKFFPTGGTSK